MTTKKRPLLYAVAATLLAATALAAGKRMTVNVEQAKIRADKQFYAPAVATVKLGDKVDVGAREDGWYAVTFRGQNGYLHESALGGAASGAGGSQWSGSDEAGADEVTLAGKGFNDDVERSYRQKHGDLDYAGVDAMEKRAVSEPVLLKFMKSGETLPQGAK